MNFGYGDNVIKSIGQIISLLNQTGEVLT